MQTSFQMGNEFDQDGVPKAKGGGRRAGTHRRFICMDEARERLLERLGYNLLKIFFIKIL